MTLPPLAHRRKFGQFFTPPDIARHMAGWVRGCRKILDPALGLGVFPHQAGSDHRFVAYEVDPVILECGVRLPNVEVRLQDYLAGSYTETFDGVLANPPYLKFHDYDNTSAVDTVNGRLGTFVSRQANLYVLFLMKAVFQLRPGGKAAFIVPSEFLGSNYGVEVKRYVAPHLDRVVALDFPVFEDATTTACLLFLTKDSPNGCVSFHRATDKDDLGGAGVSVDRASLDPVAKWRQWEVDSPIRNVVPFFEYATASRGIATGANGYFCLSEEDRKQLGLGMERVIPCLTKAVQAVPPFFTAGDFERLRSVGHEVYLVDLVGGEADPAVAAYIRRGEELGVHERHLTSHRTPWYAVERRQPPDVLTGVFGRGGVKLVLNRAGVRSLSCFHGVWFREWVPAEVSRLLLAYLVTPVAAEVLLRNRREYGDGLIKFEPRDVATAQVVDVGTLVASDRPDILAAFDRYETGREAADLTLLDSFFRRHILSTTPTH